MNSDFSIVLNLKYITPHLKYITRLLSVTIFKILKTFIEDFLFLGYQYVLGCLRHWVFGCIVFPVQFEHLNSSMQFYLFTFFSLFFFYSFFYLPFSRLPPPPPLEGPLAENDVIQKYGKRLFATRLFGPESIEPCGGIFNF